MHVTKQCASWTTNISFKEIVKQVVDILEQALDYSRTDLNRLLIKCNDSKKKDFLLFFDELASDPISAANAAKEAMCKCEQTLLKGIEATNNCISFNLNKEVVYADILKTILSKGESFGGSTQGNGKTVVIDYSSPNIAKIFHVGHFRTTILGNFIKHLLDFNGFKTVSINYLGDWGKQFGLVLLGYKVYGSAEKLKEDPLMHLFQVYVKINKDKDAHQEAREIFRKMEEDQDEEYLALWRHFREISILKYKELYQKLNIKFDVYSGGKFLY